MYDNYGFYFTDSVDRKKYDADVGLTFYLTLENNKYVIFHKRNFKKLITEDLQPGMSFVTERQNIDFQIDENYFIY